MRSLFAFVLLLSTAIAQSDAPAAKRVNWNPAVPGAAKKLQDGRVQRTVMSDSVKVSAVAAVIHARSILGSLYDGGADVAYVAIGIQNASQQTIHLDPNTITLRVIGKKERNLKPLTEEKVIARAWYANDRGGSAGPAMVGSMSGVSGSGRTSSKRENPGDASLQAAMNNQAVDKSERRRQEWSEKNTGLQAKELRDKSLLERDLAPGEQVMGLLFFYPYEVKDKVELSVPLGDTTFIIPFSGAKAKN